MRQVKAMNNPYSSSLVFLISLCFSCSPCVYLTEVNWHTHRLLIYFLLPLLLFPGTDHLKWYTLIFLLTCCDTERINVKKTTPTGEKKPYRKKHSYIYIQVTKSTFTSYNVTFNSNFDSSLFYPYGNFEWIQRDSQETGRKHILRIKLQLSHILPFTLFTFFFFLFSSSLVDTTFHFTFLLFFNKKRPLHSRFPLTCRLTATMTLAMESKMTIMVVSRFTKSLATTQTTNGAAMVLEMLTVAGVL